MFITALFTVAKTWEQCKCPLMNDWVNKIWVYVQWDINITQS